MYGRWMFDRARSLVCSRSTSLRREATWLARVSPGPRAAILLRLAAGLDEGDAAHALAIARPVYRRAQAQPGGADAERDDKRGRRKQRHPMRIHCFAQQFHEPTADCRQNAAATFPNC